MTRAFHGIAVGTERHGERIFFTLKPTGTLTHEDYKVITPIIDNATQAVASPKVYALIGATEFDGWEPRALWDDFKLGLGHRSEFVKIAIYGRQNWQKLAATIGNWFISGEVKYFEDKSAALQWLNAD